MSSAPVLDTLTHIETPENVRLAFRLAGPGSRLGAYLLDLLIRCIILWGLSMATAFFFPLLGGSGIPIGIWLVGFFLVEWWYGAFFEGYMNGQTPGKKALRLRVIKTEGYAIGFFEAVLRNFLRVADAMPLFYGVGFAAVVATPRMQRIGDLVAGTIVVREKRQKLRGELPGLRDLVPYPLGSFRNAYRPAERTLDVLESLYHRRSELGVGRVEEIAGILANPLAQRLTDPDERAKMRRVPNQFLFRILAAFQTPAESHSPTGDTSPP